MKKRNFNVLLARGKKLPRLPVEVVAKRIFNNYAVMSNNRTAYIAKELTPGNFRPLTPLLYNNKFEIETRRGTREIELSAVDCAVLYSLAFLEEHFTFYIESVTFANHAVFLQRFYTDLILRTKTYCTLLLILRDAEETCQNPYEEYVTLLANDLAASGKSGLQSYFTVH